MPSGRGAASPDFQFPSGPASRWVKLGLYFAAWGTLVLTVWSKTPDHLQSAPAFPVGLLGGLPQQHAIVVAWLGGLPDMIGGWMLYALLTYVMLRIKNIPIFLVLFAMFCILLALNLAGCNRMMKTVSGTH